MNLKLGQKLCRHCYKHVENNDSLNTEDILNTEDSFYDFTFERNESSFDDEAIGMSPIKKVSSRDKFHIVETN